MANEKSLTNILLAYYCHNSYNKKNLHPLVNQDFLIAA